MTVAGFHIFKKELGEHQTIMSNIVSKVQSQYIPNGLSEEDDIDRQSFFRSDYEAQIAMYEVFHKRNMITTPIPNVNFVHWQNIHTFKNLAFSGIGQCEFICDCIQLCICYVHTQPNHTYNIYIQII
jgi:hypothetical protein